MINRDDRKSVLNRPMPANAAKTAKPAIAANPIPSTILDGEIVALDKNGVPRFQLLQQWQKRPTAPVVLYLFDLLWSEGGRLPARAS